MPIDAILFDKDGTLFDFQATWAPVGRAALSAFPGTSPEAVAEVIGFDAGSGRFRPDGAFVSSHSAELAARLADVTSETPETVRQRLDRLGSGTRQVPVEALAETLERLATLPLGIATNDAEYSARAHLEQFDLLRYFSFVAGYDSGWGGKPEAGQLLAFAEATGLSPRRIAMVGDSLHDLTAAKAAGMVPIAVLTGAATRDMLAPHAAVVLEGIAGLPDWIEST